ncbi:MAG: nitric oxide synthase oxygenase [Nostoc sp.]
MYHWNRDEILEVEIEHPAIPKFKSLGLRWYAVPAITNFSMHVGGITYACIPFNGWYMGTEIMRDFLDEYRYNKMEDIAKVLKLDTSSEQTLWRDRVALELNVAILYSFQKAKVTMVDKLRRMQVKPVRDSVPTTLPDWKRGQRFGSVSAPLASVHPPIHSRQC